MNIVCIGTGFVGVVTTAVLAKLGNQVIGLDIDQKKVESLRSGKVPFFEPGLSELLVATQATGNLKFTTSYRESIPSADIVMIMVGTPSAPDGNADLKYVLSAAESCAPYLKNNTIIIVKSTVPPGTNQKVEAVIRSKTNVAFDIASVPEFLKEGTAVEDTLHPDRVIIGSNSGVTTEILTKLHTPLTKNIIVMKPESAQMAKYAGNVYLASRITFANQMADLCEKNGADITEVLRGIGADSRIGQHYWYPGLGYGGSCFPKDVKEIASYAQTIGETESIFIAIDEQNEKRIPRLMANFDKKVGGFSGKTVAILGLSFKPNTNDTRVAPALRVIPWLLEHGAKVRATDPKAITEITPLLPPTVSYFSDPYLAMTGADITILLVEWEEYISLDFNKIKLIMRDNPVFIDTRNQYDPTFFLSLCFRYYSIGR